MPSKESHDSQPLRDQPPVTAGEGRRSNAITDSQQTDTQLYSSDFFSIDPAVSRARNVYTKIIGGGITMIIIIIFTIFPILYGAFYKTPAGSLSGWIIVCQLFSIVYTSS